MTISAKSLKINDVVIFSITVDMIDI